MIPLYRIASRSFLLFHAENEIRQAKECVKRVHPSRVIVRDHEKHYLLDHASFLSLEADTLAPKAISEELAKHEKDAVPVLDGYSDSETVPPRCIIAVGDEVLGFHDVKLRPIATRGHEPGKEEGSQTVFLNAEIAETVQLDRKATLTVRFQSRALDRGDGLERFQILLRVETGFAIEGAQEALFELPCEVDHFQHTFSLRAIEEGIHQLRVLCLHQGQPLQELSLVSSVVRGEDVVAESRVDQENSISPLYSRQPDLTVLILESSLSSSPIITLRLLAQDPSVGLNFTEFGPVSLRMNPLDFFQLFFSDIEGLSMQTPEETRIASRKLELMGSRLSEELLPADLCSLLYTLQDRIRSVQILSDEPWIPWELLRLQTKDPSGRCLEGPFLCERFAMTRWFPGVVRRPYLKMRNLAVFVPEDEKLKYLAEERDFLRSLEIGFRTVHTISPRYVDVIEALSTGAYDSLHFSGHGRFNSGDPSRSSIRLEDSMLLAGEICGAVANCGHSQPLVFLNACQTGRGGLSLTGAGGWAKRFVSAGAAAFVGSLWAVGDQEAFEFSQAFYSSLIGGAPIAEATLQARQAIRAHDSPTWLAYTVFADPYAGLE